ncbi:hypothetical protein ACFY2W_36375 [Streptomyces sp. NPDC001262]
MSVLDKLKGLLKGREEQAPEVDTAAVSESGKRGADDNTAAEPESDE